MTYIAEGSSWDEGVKIRNFPLLTEDIEADAIVIGGGITGIATAYLLSEAGLSVVVLEKDKLAFGATGATTAFMTQYLDTPVAELKTLFGPEKTKEILNSHAEAISLVEAVTEKEKIDCDFSRCSNYIIANTDKDAEKLKSEQEAAAEAGLTMQLKPAADLPFKNRGSLELAYQAKIHPLKFLAAIVETLHRRGVRIFERTEAVEMRTGARVAVKAAGHTVTARYAVVATYAPFDKKLFLKKAFYTSYVFEAALPAGALPEAIYEDMARPYHYFRVDRPGEGDRLIIGGEDHRSDVPVDSSKNWQALEEYLRRTFVGIPLELRRRWSGPILETLDGLAYIGPLGAKNIFYATGFSGNGLTYAVIAAKTIADLISGRENSWAALYDPRRHAGLKQLLYKGRDYTGEFLGGAMKNMLRYRKRKDI